MHTYDTYREILYLWKQGNEKAKIARLTGISRTTVRDCITRYQDVDNLRETFLNQEKCIVIRKLQALDDDNNDLKATYAYMLGMYLGDGYIGRAGNTYKLRISLDRRYPDIIERCIYEVGKLAPKNKVNFFRIGNMVEVYCHSNQWIEFFLSMARGKNMNAQLF